MKCEHCNREVDLSYPHLCVSVDDKMQETTVHYYTPDTLTPLLEYMMSQAITNHLKKTLDI